MNGGSIEVALWMDRRQYDALRRALAESETTVETVMQARLDEFYRQTVPGHERQEISMEIEAERLAAERWREENRRVSAFHITEKGQDSFFVTEKPMDLLEMAKLIRWYLREGAAASIEQFAACFPADRQLEADQFPDFAERRLADPQKVVSVFHVDFDARRVSSLDPFRGWQTFKMKDVSTAAYHASRKMWQSDKRQWNIFRGHLEGKEIGQETDAGPEMRML